MQIRLGNLQGNLTNTSNRLDLLSRGVDTILGETPEVHELLSVHKSLESAESLLFEHDVTISSSESCAIATHAAKSILSNYQSDWCPNLHTDADVYKCLLWICLYV